MKSLMISAAAAAALACAGAAYGQTPEPAAETVSTVTEAPAAEASLQPAVQAEPAAPPVADPTVYQVLRTGDRQMSCEQLSYEANTLNAQLLAEQKVAQKKAGRSKAGRAVGGAVAGGALRTAGRIGLARFGGGLGAIGFMAAHAANDAASQGTAQVIANGGAGAEGPGVTPQQQRMNHLLGVYREKQC